MEIARFEKRGFDFLVTFENGKVFIEVGGEKDSARAFEDPKRGWTYMIGSSEHIYKPLGLKKFGSIMIAHESAEKALDLLVEAKEEQKKKEKEKVEAEKEEIRSGKKKISVRYHDGEYLSAYSVHGLEAQLLEELGLAKYIEGWGYKVDEGLVKALGKEFTYQKAHEFARPALEEKAKKEAEKKAELQAKFDQAKKTGNPVEMHRWIDDCNDPNEDCDLDNVVVYAMPDGSTKTVRHHTW